MSDLEFGDMLLTGDEGWVGELPAPSRPAHSHYDTVVDDLRTRPGVWKVVAVYRKEHYAVPMRTGGLISQLQRAGCHVATRVTGDGEHTNIYARWPRPDDLPPTNQKAEHGTTSMYTNQKCRCDECKTANRLYSIDYKARTRRARR